LPALGLEHPEVLRGLRRIVQGGLGDVAFLDLEAPALRGLDIGTVEDPAHRIKAIRLIENLGVLSEELLQVGRGLISVLVDMRLLLLVVELSDEVVELGLLEAEVLH
jgi:hypothetical protein